MTKQEWLIERKKVEIPMSVWHEYYLECGGYVKDLNEFSKIFANVLYSQPVFEKDGKTIQVTMITAIKRLNDYYNSKFGC